MNIDLIKVRQKMRSKQMLSGCSCLKIENPRKSLGFLGVPPQNKDTVDALFQNVLKVSGLNTLTNETPNLFDGFEQLVSALGLDIDSAEKVKIFSIDPATPIGKNNFKVSDIVYILNRFLRLAQNTQTISSNDLGVISSRKQNNPEITLEEYVDFILGFLEKEKTKGPLLARIVEREEKRSKFTKELQEYLGWNESTSQFDDKINPRDFFEHFLAKYRLDDPRFGFEFYGSTNIIIDKDKVFDPMLLQSLIGMSLSYGSAIKRLSVQEIKMWASEISRATEENKARNLPSLRNSTAIEITRGTLGLKQSTKIILGVGGFSVLGILGYHLLKTNYKEN